MRNLEGTSRECKVGTHISEFTLPQIVDLLKEVNPSKDTDLKELYRHANYVFQYSVGDLNLSLANSDERGAVDSLISVGLVESRKNYTLTQKGVDIITAYNNRQKEINEEFRNDITIVHKEGRNGTLNIEDSRLNTDHGHYMRPRVCVTADDLNEIGLSVGSGDFDCFVITQKADGQYSFPCQISALGNNGVTVYLTKRGNEFDPEKDKLETGQEYFLSNGDSIKIQNPRKNIVTLQVKI